MKFVGTGPTQAPTCGDLGTMAFQNADDVTITGGISYLTSKTAANYYNDTAISDVKPSLLLDFANTEVLDPRVTFTRASTATYYDGKSTAIAEQNLIVSSQTFNVSPWYANNSVGIIDNSIPAPDGTLTAAKLFAGTFSTTHAYSQNVSVTGASTFSIYLKAGEVTTMRIALRSDNNAYARFDLSAGTVLGSSGLASATISSASNGFYRVVMTTDAVTTANRILIFASDSFSTYSGDGASGFYIWGAQLEQRSFTTAYIPTTTAAITNYIPALQTAAAGIARFDHDPITGESKGLLIEEQRTNLFNNSNLISGWTSFYLSTIANSIVSPDGTLNATKLVTNTSSGYQGRYYGVNLSASTAYTFSIYAKAGEYKRLFVTTANSSQVPQAIFDLSTGTIASTGASTTATITSVGNGWYRCTATATSGVGGADYLAVYVHNGITNNYAGDGYSGIYVWGAQFETGSFATSVIPTAGSTVTRSADTASMTGTNFSSWYRQAGGTICVDLNTVNTYNTYAVSLESDANNRINIGSIGINSFFVSRINGVSVQFSVGTFPIGNSKLAATVVSGDINYCVNGVNGGPATQSLPTVTSMHIGYTPAIFSYFINGTVKRITYYPARLSNAELQEMTS